MPRIPDIIPITDLREEAAGALKRLRESRRPLIVTQHGRAAAVMLSLEAYEQAEHEREILRALVKGDREIAKGTGHDLDRVLAEADAILASAAR